MIRLAFVLGGIEFDDERISAEEWKQIKPTTPYGKLPILYVDGQKVAQSIAILRYVGKLGGLYPEEKEQALRVDEVMDVAGDVSGILSKGATSEEAGKMMQGLERRVNEWGDGEWLVGDSVSVADLAVVGLVVNMKGGRWKGVEADEVIGERVGRAVQGVMNKQLVKEWYQRLERERKGM